MRGSTGERSRTPGGVASIASVIHTRFRPLHVRSRALPEPVTRWAQDCRAQRADLPSNGVAAGSPVRARQKRPFSIESTHPMLPL